MKVTHRRSELEATDSFGLEVQLVGSLSDEQQQKLLEVVSRCPVHKTIERGSEVVTSVVSAGDLLDEAVSLCKHMRDMEQACDRA